MIGGKVQLENVKCEEDFMPKSIVLEMNYDTKWVVVNKFTIEKCQNYFKFSRFNGNFRITAEAKGYNVASSEFEINNATKDTLLLNDIILTKLANQLEEVVVIGNSGKKEFIKVEANKTTVQISNNDFYLNGSVNDAITKLPGIIPGPNGTVMLNGKSVLVWVDGQSTGLSGDDLVNFLNSLPANLVEKVEIISNPDASFDANTSTGVLNIITSNKSFKGISGTITSNFYRSDYNNFSNSISLNGKIKKLSWQTSFGNNLAKTDNIKSLNLGFLDFNPAQNLSQEYSAFSDNDNYFFRSSLQYSLNENIKIGLKYGLNTGENNQSSTGYVRNESNELSNSKGSPASKNTLNDITFSYTHILDKWGRKLNLISNYSNYNKNQNTELRQFYNNINPDKTYSISDLNSKVENFNIKVDFDIPFNKKNLSLKLGSKWSYNRYNSLGQYNLNSTDSSILDSNSYNDEKAYFNNESIFAIYTELGKEINKWHFSTGLRWENFKSESIFQNANRLNDFFPSAAILYKFGNNIEFKINYARKIDRPGYSNLDPNISDLMDSYTTIQGNPYLKPDIIHRFETGLSFMKYVSVGFSYNLSDTENYIVFENLGNFQTVQSQKTFYDVGNYNFNISLPIPFGVFKDGMSFFNNPKNLDINKMNLIYFNAGIGQTLLENTDNYFKANKPLKSFMAYTQIILPFETKLHLNYFISKGTYQIYYLNQPIQALSIYLIKPFLKDRLKVSLYANDIFNTQNISALAQSENLNINYFKKDNTRFFGVKLSYNFGKFSAMHKQQEIEDIDEKERLEEKKIKI